MTWIWYTPPSNVSWYADYDTKQDTSKPWPDYFPDSPLIGDYATPRYKTRRSLKKFRALHCPPIGIQPVVDECWRNIILRYVPENRVQFIRVRLNAPDGYTEEYSWVLPFDKVLCIDRANSIIPKLVDYGESINIMQIDRVVHFPRCMGGFHLARDAQMRRHIVVSDELRDALAATGEEVVFWRPEESRMQ